MYIVTNNREFYPSVEYFESREQAEAQMDRWVKDHDQPCDISLAEVIETIVVKAS